MESSLYNIVFVSYKCMRSAIILYKRIIVLIMNLLFIKYHEENLCLFVSLCLVSIHWM
jgi:hypothetical protein